MVETERENILMFPYLSFYFDNLLCISDPFFSFFFSSENNEFEVKPTPVLKNNHQGKQETFTYFYSINKPQKYFPY